MSDLRRAPQGIWRRSLRACLSVRTKKAAFPAWERGFSNEKGHASLHGLFFVIFPALSSGGRGAGPGFGLGEGKLGAFALVEHSQDPLGILEGQ